MSWSPDYVMLCVLAHLAKILGGKFIRHVIASTPASTWMVRYAISSNFTTPSKSRFLWKFPLKKRNPKEFWQEQFFGSKNKFLSNRKMQPSTWFFLALLIIDVVDRHNTPVPSILTPPPSTMVAQCSHWFDWHLWQDWGRWSMSWWCGWTRPSSRPSLIIICLS